MRSNGVWREPQPAADTVERLTFEVSTRHLCDLGLGGGGMAHLHPAVAEKLGKTNAADAEVSSDRSEVLASPVSTRCGVELRGKYRRDGPPSRRCGSVRTRGARPDATVRATRCCQVRGKFREHSR